MAGLHRPGRRPRQPGEHHRVAEIARAKPLATEKRWIDEMIAAERAAREQAFARQ